jgi:hypothetical protein
VVGEALVAYAVAWAFLNKFGGDSLGEVRRNYEGYVAGLSAKPVPTSLELSTGARDIIAAIRSHHAQHQVWPTRFGLQRTLAPQYSAQRIDAELETLVKLGFADSVQIHEDSEIILDLEKLAQ